MTEEKPDIIASVQFILTDAGGRKSPVLASVFKCIFDHGGELNDCALMLNGFGDVWPGQQIKVPIRFLRPDLVRPRIKSGDGFKLREDRTIAEGIIEEIVF